MNVLGTQLLLDSLEKTSVRSFVLASTADVYLASDKPHSENDPLGTTNIYGVSKIADEHLLKLAEMRYPRVRFFAARLSNLFGPGETNPHVLPDIMADIQRGTTLSLGNLEPLRDYNYVGDAAEALVKMATYHGEHRIFNVSAGRGTSVRDLVHTIGQIIGRDLSIEVNPAKVRRVERPTLVLDNSLIQRELHWRPEVSLEEGLRRTLLASVRNALTSSITS